MQPEGAGETLQIRKKQRRVIGAALQTLIAPVSQLVRVPATQPPGRSQTTQNYNQKVRPQIRAIKQSREKQEIRDKFHSGEL